jgi:polysaccharide export outer membrane protein
MIKHLCWLSLALGLAGCAATPAPRLADSVSRTEFVAATYRLGVGDRVRVEVFREADLSGEASIESTGFINYPLIGYVPAVGLTPRELEQDLIRRLRGDYLRNPDVRVYVVRYRPVFVSGAVRNTGAYPFTEGLNVEKALTLASGMTPLGSPRRIFVLREGAPASAREKVGLDAPLYPGDTLFVEEGVF